MAGEIPPLTITVNIETSGVKAGVDQATASLKNITAAAETTGSKFTGLKNVMLGTFAGTQLTQGLSRLEGFLKSSVAAANEAQTSVVALSTAMNDAKINTNANRDAVEKVTVSMSNLGFAGNSTREALTKIVTATGSVSEAQKLMGVTADYARLKHMDLASAASILTRGTTGAMRAFREYGIVLDTTIPKSQAITKAFNELNQKIGGQAAAYAETYAGKMEILGAKSEELKEKIGTLLIPVLTKLSSWFIGSMEWLLSHKAALEAVAVLIGGILTAVVINLTKKLYIQAAAWLANNGGILLIVAGLAALAAGFVYAWNHSETFRKVVTEGIKIVLTAVGYLIGGIGKIVEAMSHLPGVGKHFTGLADNINGAALAVGKMATNIDSLSSKKIDIKMPDFKSMLANAGGLAGFDPNIAASGSVAGAASTKAAAAAQNVSEKIQADLKKHYNTLNGLYADYSTELQDRQDRMNSAMDDKRARDLDAQTRFDQTKADIDQKYQDAMQTALTAHTDAVEAIERSHSEKVIQIEQGAVDKRAAIVAKSIDALTSTWQSATKLDLATLFAAGGESATGLVTALQDQLKSVLQLQTDAGALAAAGYSQSFIDQVIAKGPDVGDKMAQAVLNATPETANQIKSLYSQIDSVSQTGLTQLATTMNDGMHFANLSLADEYAQVATDLQSQLADENTSYKDALTQAQDSYERAQAAAGNARDLATKQAQDALAGALKSSQESYDKMISDISDSTDKKLTALQNKIRDTLNLIAQLGGGGSSSSSTGTGAGDFFNSSSYYNPGGSSSSTSSGGATATPSGAIVFNQTNNIDGNTSPATIGANTLDMIKYGTPAIIAGTSGIRYI